MEGYPEKEELEKSVREHLYGALDFRFDICTCQHCKDTMLAAALASLPSRSEHAKSSCGKDDASPQLHLAIKRAIDTVSLNPPHRLKENKNQTLHSIMKKILVERGLDLRNYHHELLKRRLALRIHSNNLDSYAAYLHFLTKHPEEYDKLFETLCINVSEFFRDPPVWITLQYLFDSLLRRKAASVHKHLRVWSAGCACGEEAYSLAMLISEALQNQQEKFKIEIIATDIDKACLSNAHQAAYPKDSLKNLDTKRLKYFEPAESDLLRLKEGIKEMVEFRYLDLTSQEFLTNIDVLTCRNVFIYFNKQLQEELLKKFHSALAPEGYLVMGRAESMSAALSDYFDGVDTNARIYRKKLIP